MHLSVDGDVSLFQHTSSIVAGLCSTLHAQPETTYISFSVYIHPGTTEKMQLDREYMLNEVKVMLSEIPQDGHMLICRK